jgi:hypothetical protein
MTKSGFANLKYHLYYKLSCPHICHCIYVYFKDYHIVGLTLGLHTFVRFFSLFKTFTFVIFTLMFISFKFINFLKIVIRCWPMLHNESLALSLCVYHVLNFSLKRSASQGPLAYV